MRYMFLQVDESPNTGKVSLGLSVIVRVTLKDGAYHEVCTGTPPSKPPLCGHKVDSQTNIRMLDTGTLKTAKGRLPLLRRRKKKQQPMP